MLVIYKGKTYKYIFSFLDVFSCFHWLRPLESKYNSGVKKELKKIFFEHGFLKRLQNDNRREFKKHVKEFCTTNKVKMVRCRPYHPETKGKVKCTHRVLRQKIHSDMASKINWANQLPNYARCLNNEIREELGWKSPFEIHFGRKSNELVNAGSAYDGLITTMEIQQPTISDQNLHLKKTQKWRDSVKNASNRLDKRMIRTYAKKH